MADAGSSELVAAQAALDWARELDRQGDESSVDYFYRAAAQASLLPTADGPTAQVYCEAMTGLLDAGQRYGRLDPRGTLVVDDGGRRVVPLRYYGFPWRPADFSRLSFASEYSAPTIARRIGNPGIGVPMVVERIAESPGDEFMNAWQPFGATAVLRPIGGGHDLPGGTSARGFALEFYNPLAIDSIVWQGGQRPLARDLTAPLAAVVDETPRQYLRGFTSPGDTSVRPKLAMLEPYQRGKMPVVLIHGLYSDPVTWSDMLNELQSQGDLYQRYQFWTFRYPTGGEVLASAAALRRQLYAARSTFDPAHADAALDSMVVVGHSLGGLVAEMETTASYNLLWREIANDSFATLRAPPEVRQQLASEFFFTPVPMIRRVVFIGTPHQGSSMARRLAGKLGNALIHFSPDVRSERAQLVE
ncbi:MAG: hypothetical protein KDA44_16010, partial [Planctomycetales bacterium]|nr:hypothetical protein [Planctomycetales bacterium]